MEVKNLPTQVREAPILSQKEQADTAALGLTQDWDGTNDNEVCSFRFVDSYSARR